jgi:hypothetical protein
MSKTHSQSAEMIARFIQSGKTVGFQVMWQLWIWFTKLSPRSSLKYTVSMATVHECGLIQIQMMTNDAKRNWFRKSNGFRMCGFVRAKRVRISVATWISETDTDAYASF